MDQPSDQPPKEFPAELPPPYAFDMVIRGYAISTVCELLTRVQRTLADTADEHERVTPEIIRATELRPVLRGYDRHQVDEALLDCARQLESQAAGGTTHRPSDQARGESRTEPLPYAFDVVIRGYAPQPVHELLTRVQRTLAGTADEQERVTPEIIRATELKRALRGYDRHQVDEALLDCARSLRDH